MQKQRVNGRVQSVYIGAGHTADLVAALDTRARLDQQRAAARCAACWQATMPPVELCTYGDAVRVLTASLLRSLGFHQHKRQWRYSMADDTKLPSAPAGRTRVLFMQRTLNTDEQGELRQLLRVDPAEARRLGELSYHTAQVLIRALGDESSAAAVVVEARYQHLRHDLAGVQPSELERLLADNVALCWISYYRTELLYASNTQEATGQSLDTLERWERILSSAQARYLRAVESLARVRRLLRLPAVQVNIAADGGQQVNITGGLTVER